MKITAVLVVLPGWWVISVAAEENPLTEAEVRLPYRELMQLIEGARQEKAREPVMAPALMSSELKFSGEDGAPVIEAAFEVVRFGDEVSRIPLIGGGLALEIPAAEGIRMVLHESMLCDVGSGRGVKRIEAKLRPAGAGFELLLPECAGTTLDAERLDTGLEVDFGEGKRFLGAGKRLALPPTARRVTIRILEEGELVYLLLGHGLAEGGSGVEATLRLPQEARGVDARSEDLVSARTSRDPDGNLELHLKWNSRDLLERDVVIGYRMPLRPLDQRWTLKSPSGDGEARTRFFLPVMAALNYRAEGMSGPLVPESLPTTLAKHLNATPCFMLDGMGAIELTVERRPVVATEDAVVPKAEWVLTLETDGSLLAEGSLEVDHGAAQRIRLDTPEGLVLLGCEVAGRPVDPIDLGNGGLEIALPEASGPHRKPTNVGISFTGRSAEFDPLEGTLSLALPRTPLFIRTLGWRIELPAGYKAEVHGNLTRETGGDPDSAIRLRKNLCRDERPTVEVFYRSRNLVP